MGFSKQNKSLPKTKKEYVFDALKQLGWNVSK